MGSDLNSSAIQYIKPVISLKMFENSILRRIFGLHNEELHSLAEWLILEDWDGQVM